MAVVKIAELVNAGCQASPAHLFPDGAAACVVNPAGSWLIIFRSIPFRPSRRVEVQIFQSCGGHLRRENPPRLHSGKEVKERAGYGC
jgi:hypothetical protein